MDFQVIANAAAVAWVVCVSLTVLAARVSYRKLDERTSALEEMLLETEDGE